MGRPLNNWRGSCRGPLLWKEVRRVDISINAQRSVPVRHPSVTASLSKKKEEKKKQRIKTRDYSLALCFPFVAPLLLSSHAKGSSHSAVLYLFAKEASVLLLPKPYKLTLEIKKKTLHSAYVFLQAITARMDVPKRRESTLGVSNRCAFCKLDAKFSR